jgi:hypothetical protein
MKRLLVSIALVLFMAGMAHAQGPFQVRLISETVQAFDTSAGVTRAPTATEATQCVWVVATGSDIYYTLGGTTPTTGSAGTVLVEDTGILFVPDEIKRFRFTGDGVAAGWVTYRAYDNWIPK